LLEINRRMIGAFSVQETKCPDGKQTDNGLTNITEQSDQTIRQLDPFEAVGGVINQEHLNATFDNFYSGVFR